MKSCSPLRSLFSGIVLLGLAAWSFTGCAKFGTTRAAALSDSLPQAAGEIETAKRQVAEANAVIQSMAAAAPGTDLRPSLERYRGAIASLDYTLALLKQRTQDMNERGDRYFSTWRASVEDLQGDGSRRRSESRERELKEHFGQIRSRYMVVRHEFDPLMVKLYDSRALLSVETQATPVHAQNFARRIDVDAKMTLQALETLSESLRALGADGTVAVQ